MIEPPPDVPIPVMTYDERQRFRAAAFRATRLYPGPIGEMLSRELISWEEFGFRFGSGALLRGVVEEIMNASMPKAEAA